MQFSTAFKPTSSSTAAPPLPGPHCAAGQAAVQPRVRQPEGGHRDDQGGPRHRPGAGGARLFPGCGIPKHSHSLANLRKLHSGLHLFAIFVSSQTGTRLLFVEFFFWWLIQPATTMVLNTRLQAEGGVQKPVVAVFWIFLSLRTGMVHIIMALRSFTTQRVKNGCKPGLYQTR